MIGELGTILGQAGVNIAAFALGRTADKAVGVVAIDEPSPVSDDVLARIRAAKAIREARIVRV